jgi:hypothetical protein
LYTDGAPVNTLTIRRQKTPSFPHIELHLFLSFAAKKPPEKTPSFPSRDS